MMRTVSEIKTQLIHKTSDARLRRKAPLEQLDLKSILGCGNLKPLRNLISALESYKTQKHAKLTK